MPQSIGVIIFIGLILLAFIAELRLAVFLTKQRLGIFHFSLGTAIIFGLLIFIASLLDPRQLTIYAIGKEVLGITIFMFFAIWLVLKIHIQTKRGE